MTVVGVYLVGVPYVADKQYDYVLPPHLPRPSRGAIVTVPFGRGDHHRSAIVAVCEDRENDRSLKAVFAVEDERFALSEEMFALAAFLREHTLCSFGDAARAILRAMPPPRSVRLPNTAPPIGAAFRRFLPARGARECAVLLIAGFLSTFWKALLSVSMKHGRWG